ncbi:hypothetical protein AB0B66_18780 [Catellatospora sp. NPDC049111]|uniref:hypothetical protein n=1 Tax=Catellatospora sp. NPDC049111 TaxID=3155271 RepID=UPI0033EE3CD6
MSLVVAQIHDGRISLVADTKITDYNDVTKTRRVLTNAVPKILILRERVAVGITGDNHHLVLQKLVEIRDEPLAVLREQMHEIAVRWDSHGSVVSFVLAGMEPEAQLWEIGPDTAEERTAYNRAWAGDLAAYNYFRQRFDESATGYYSSDMGWRLLSSMQWLTSFNVVESVGGFVTRACFTGESFKFIGDFAIVGPWLMEMIREETPEGAKLALRPPRGIDPRGYQVFTATGRTPTISALAYFVPQARRAWLFRHETPWESVGLNVSSLAELLAVGASEYGQNLDG